MIISFKFKNFYSFKDETGVSFENSRADPNDGLYVETLGFHISKAIMVTGANGAGKSNVLKALDFVHGFMFRSFGKEVGLALFEPYFFSEDSEPSEFTLEFIAIGKLYRYQLNVDKKRVLFEKLEVKNTSQYSYLFKREYDPKKDTYNYQDKAFGFEKKIASQIKQNDSIISTAIQYNIPLAIELESNFVCVSNMNVFRSAEVDINIAAKFYNDFPHLKERMRKILPVLDLGLTDIDILHYTNEKGEKIYFPVGVHKYRNNVAKVNFFNQSRGTQAIFCLLVTLISVLSEGAVAIIDELDTHLHVDMLNHILEMFLNSHTNSHNAQIIFTSHLTEPMQVLDKYQILLVEKDKDLVSHAWRIADIEGVRPDENIYKKYKSGAYGAIPNIGLIEYE